MTTLKTLATLSCVIFALGCNLSLDPQDSPDSGGGIPVVSASQFQSGDRFVWKHYSDRSMTASTAERFTIESVEGSNVTLLIEYSVGQSGWSFRQQYVADLSTCDPTTPGSQKFNCDPSIPSGGSAQSASEQLGPGMFNLVHGAVPSESTSSDRAWYISDSGKFHGLLGQEFNPQNVERVLLDSKSP